LSVISWIFETGPSNLENFLTCDHFPRLLIFPIHAVLLSISPFFDVYIVTIKNCGSLKITHSTYF